VPLLKGGALLGVLDLDSPEPARFDQADAEGLGQAVQLFLAASDMTRLADAAPSALNPPAALPEEL
jgi:hypothetical protein